MSESSCQHLRQTIRHQTRERRRALLDTQQQQAATAVCSRFTAHPNFANTHAIALYLSVDGELSTAPLIEACWQAKKQLYLPVLHPFCKGHLLFQRYQPHTTIVTNRLGINEPQLNCSEVHPVNQLDMVITPLVAFDRQGNRLGMGGGFYDRTFSHLGSHVQRVGIAHDLQCYPKLPTAIWDQPLNRIFTPSELFEWPAKSV
ncbi:5-formyltetrahydrofolate cyclo-ligase [Celerinatantimonas yamalensis]|uniref:5-formyltetrahydrofolate cyclo-ligase n=1 Tax=Celerinatantimonas yamalensis TaxID=559956 RepID=A0ABW9GAB1_9GAMM